jgi:hypothetical protein
MAIAFPVNLGALGNSLAIWLGISPWQLFFYVFLPPLLLDAAVRIDWFMFRKVRRCFHARLVKCGMNPRIVPPECSCAHRCSCSGG